MNIVGATILIIDDNDVNRSILLEQAEEWRCDSAAAASGEEGLAIMRAAIQQGVEIDCVILDYQMPAMNGGDVVAQMRADPKLAAIPVVMLTSVEETEDGKTFSTLDIAAHLTKPARSGLLLSTVARVLKPGSARAAGHGTPAEGKHAGADPAPAHKPDERAQSSQTTAPEFAESKEVEDDGRLDVIVCEDNEVNQIVFTQILQSGDYSFMIANNDREGVELIKEHRPKVVIMDVSMPEMNGLEATGKIRQMDGAISKTPIIGVTAHAIKGDQERCLGAGMTDYLSKPVSPDALLAKLEAYLSKSAILAETG